MIKSQKCRRSGGFLGENFLDYFSSLIVLAQPPNWLIFAVNIKKFADGSDLLDATGFVIENIFPKIYKQQERETVTQLYFQNSCPEESLDERITQIHVNSMTCRQLGVGISQVPQPTCFWQLGTLPDPTQPPTPLLVQEGFDQTDRI